MRQRVVSDTKIQNMITATETANLRFETATECMYGEAVPFMPKIPLLMPTLAAMQEAKDIASGKIPGKWYHSLEEARKELYLAH